MNSGFLFKKNLDIKSLFLVILLLLQEKFFYLIPLNGLYVLNGNQQQILMVLITIFSFILMFLVHKVKQTRFSSFALCIFFCCYLGAFVHSASVNGQSIVDVFIASNYYLMILSFPLFYLIIEERGLISFLKYIVWFAAVNIAVCWLQYLCAGFGFIFTKMSLEGSRFGSLRIWDMSETLTCVGVIVSLLFFLYNKTKYKYIYLLIYIVGLLGNIYVSKGRIALIGIILASIIIILFKFKKNAISVFAVIIAILALFYVVPSTDIGQMYFNSFDQAETNTASVRMREYNYYYQQICSNPIWGIGFIRDNGDLASVILRGPIGQYSRTDIGLIGVWDTIGLAGFIWFVLMHIRFVYILFKRWAYFKDFDKSILLSLLIFSLVLMPTMAMLNPFSITTFIIIFAIFESYSVLISQKEY